MRFVIIIAMFAFCSPQAEAIHVYSQFAGGYGQWRADGVKHIERQVSTNASLSLGLDSGHKNFFGFLKADSTRLMNVPYQGIGPDQSQRRHEIEGVGVAVGWRTQRYMGWLGHGGGRWRVIGKLGDISRYTYRSPFVGYGVRIYQSSISSILLMYQVSRFEPEDSWYGEYGLSSPWQQHISIAFQLRSQD